MSDETTREVMRLLAREDWGHPLKFDHDKLRAVLIRCACPIVCVGHRQPPPGPDWHEWCERKADAALAILESVSPPAKDLG